MDDLALARREGATRLRLLLLAATGLFVSALYTAVVPEPVDAEEAAAMVHEAP